MIRSTAVRQGRAQKRWRRDRQIGRARRTPRPVASSAACHHIAVDIHRTTDRVTRLRMPSAEESRMLLLSHLEPIRENENLFGTDGQPRGLEMRWRQRLTQQEPCQAVARKLSPTSHPPLSPSTACLHRFAAAAAALGHSLNARAKSGRLRWRPRDNPSPAERSLGNGDSPRLETIPGN